MNPLTIVIPSRKIDNLLPCLAGLAVYEPGVRVIVIDDGLDLSNARQLALIHACGDIFLGEKPFIYARNCNLGIRQAGADDLLLLNDDALLETPGGFTAMQRAAYEHPEYGVISAACNNVGNINQHRRTTHLLRQEPRMVCFVAVLIPRTTIERVGLLDEQFVDYGCEDDDYCVRVRGKGLKIGVFDGCYVDHKKLTSTFRGATNNGGRGGDFRPNLRRFIAKHGVDNWGRTKQASAYRECFPI